MRCIPELHGSLVALAALLLVGCKGSPQLQPSAPSVPDVAVDAGMDASSVDAGMDASSVDAGMDAASRGDGGSAALADGPSAADWLAAHGMKDWTGDDACPAPLCICDESFTIDGKPPRDFLVCKGTGASSDPYAPIAGHTVVYVADKGKLRVVFDLVTLLFPDGPHQGGVLALSHVVTDKHELVFTDEANRLSSSRCADALAALDDMLRGNNDALLKRHRDAYAAMCNSRGTYAFAGGRFKKTR